MSALPAWAQRLADLYESGAYSQFLVSGNVHDRLLLPPTRAGASGELRGLDDFLYDVLLPRFDVVLAYDVGHGVRVVRGGAIFREWPRVANGAALPRGPREAVEALTQYLHYQANLVRMGRPRLQVACIVGDAQLVAPGLPGGLHYDLNATALLLRDWSRDGALEPLSLATFLVSESLADLHPLLAQNPRAAHVEVPLPQAQEMQWALGQLAPTCPVALQRYRENLAEPARQLAGATLASVEALLRTREHLGQPLEAADLAALKKELVERECSGLVEFLEPDRSLGDYIGHEPVVEWLRQDLELWKRGELGAMPMGYLLCGPVGTGKTFLVECLAGEAGIPVVVLKNFRDKWVGSTESNLERIFRLLHALGRCYVFVDEADQALGSRSAGAGDSGISGRVYSMLADEMSDTRNRGRIVWVLASSRPDLIEPDLKRPGRIDVRLPLLPAASTEESAALLRALCRARGMRIDAPAMEALSRLLPAQLTPGSAEALAVRVFRLTRTGDLPPREALRRCLEGYRPPISPDVMAFQIGLAVAEATDVSLVPPAFRDLG